jgi:hypothetical protein
MLCRKVKQLHHSNWDLKYHCLLSSLFTLSTTYGLPCPHNVSPAATCSIKYFSFASGDVGKVSLEHSTMTLSINFNLDSLEFCSASLEALAACLRSRPVFVMSYNAHCFINQMTLFLLNCFLNSGLLRLLESK